MTTEASSDEVVFATRPMRPSDEALLFNSFLRDLHGSDYVRGIPDDLFYDVFKREWATVLASFTTLVAHPEGSEEEIAGYIVYRRNVVAGLYVKLKPWRGFGVARRLLAEAGFRKGERVWLMYGSSRALADARARGWNVAALAHAKAMRLLLGFG